MRIRLKGHVRLRMEQRDVVYEDVERALLGFQLSESLKLDADPGKSRIVGPSVDGFRLHVVIMGELPPGRLVQVVSVYWKREGAK